MNRTAGHASTSGTLWLTFRSLLSGITNAEFSVTTTAMPIAIYPAIIANTIVIIPTVPPFFAYVILPGLYRYETGFFYIDILRNCWRNIRTDTLRVSALLALMAFANLSAYHSVFIGVIVLRYVPYDVLPLRT
jgi:hypothetical protein